MSASRSVGVVARGYFDTWGLILLIARPERKSSKSSDRIIKWTSVRVTFTFFHTFTFHLFLHRRSCSVSPVSSLHHLLFLVLYSVSCLSIICQGSSKTRRGPCRPFLFFFYFPVLSELCGIFPPTPHLLSVSLVIRLSLTLRASWRWQ